MFFFYVIIIVDVIISLFNMFFSHHQPAADLLGPEAETQTQEDEGRTRYSTDPRIPGVASQPQRTQQTESAGENRFTWPGMLITDHLGQIWFCRAYPSVHICSVFDFLAFYNCISAPGSHQLISHIFQHRSAGLSSISFPLRRSDSLMSEASGNLLT